ncbi:hypothetical protein GLI01_02950 [Gluconacetobacter liquefaciens]|nr:hypothetical protein AA0522_0155 [Gluconacetobacter liquefaciens NRIC 0522]GEB36260.1 hypothetical protein GLI01_02950 [Gluconacetobacter liquefaciens]
MTRTVIAAIGRGWAFLINGATGRRSATNHPRIPEKRWFLRGFPLCVGRGDLRAILIMFFLIGTIPEAFLGSGRKESRFDLLLTGAGIFGTGCARAGH